MAFPRRLLVEGEELVLELRPHWFALALPTVVTLGVVLFGFWLTLKANWFPDWVFLVAMVDPADHLPGPQDWCGGSRRTSW